MAALSGLVFTLACSSGGGGDGDGSGDVLDDGGLDTGDIESDADAVDSDALEEVGEDAPDDGRPDGDDDTTDVEDADDTTEDVDAGPPPDWPEDVPRLVLDEAGTASVRGTFAGAAPLSDVTWARAPRVACWANPIQDEFYSAAHVGWALDEPIPPWHEVIVTLTPDEGVEANLYVLSQEADRFAVPPAIDEAAFCWRPITYGSPGVASTIRLQTHGDETRNLYVGVSSRGRFGRDGSFDVAVEARPLPSAEQCFADIEQPYQWPDPVRRIQLDENGRWVGRGRLQDGAPVCNLDFINDAFCAPSIRNAFFEGNHVFYALDEPMPRDSYMTVTVTPAAGVDINMYGGRQGADSGFSIPPEFTVSDCDTSPGVFVRNPGTAESLTFVSTTNPYNVFFAVNGDDIQGATGEYVISIERISTSTDNCTTADYNDVAGLTAWPDSVTAIEIVDGVGIVSGDLGDGEVPCTLDWAERSDVACFPLVQRDYFDGNHQYYAITEPVPAGATVTIRAIPEPDVHVGLYGFRLGQGDVVLPPLVAGVQCEADYPREVFTRTPGPGQMREITFYSPNGGIYTYFIGVAGFAEGVNSGRYTLEVIVEEPPPPHCPESLPGTNWATWSPEISLISLDATGSATGRGNLADGRCMNLRFAADSQIACFPATRFDRFEGNHVFFALNEPMPPRSEMVITITPDPGVEVNAYGAQQGVTDFNMPPLLSPGVVCEASYGLSGPNPGGVETLRFSNPSDRNSYNVMFVASGDGTTGTTGGFRYAVQLNVGQTWCEESLDAPPSPTSYPAEVNRIALDGSGRYTATANLSAGRCMNLDFAAQSDVACFPATRFDRYEGNHVFYEITTPMPANSSMAITVQPVAGVDVSIYGFLMGDTDYPTMPPYANNVQCEASHGLFVTGGNPGEPETIQFQNPTSNTYRVFFAVAGPRDVTSGAYDIRIQQEVAGTHCEESLPGIASPTDWPASVLEITLGADGRAQRNDTLTSGACTNLDFAARSNVACFPATQNAWYEGKHRYYALAQPMPPRSELEVRVVPTNPSAPVSLYGMQTGLTSFYVPPQIAGNPICEAASPLNPFLAGEPTRIRFQNPSYSQSYNIFVGVAGADDSAGNEAYQLQFELTVAD